MRLSSSLMRQDGNRIRRPSKKMERFSRAAPYYNDDKSSALRPRHFLAANTNTLLFPVTTCTKHCFSTATGDDTSSKDKPHIVLQKLGDFPYGSREYRLVVQSLPSPTESNSDTTTTSSSDDPTTSKTLASLRAHRNILFGAQLQPSMMPGSKSSSKHQQRSLTEVCGPLLDAALEDAGVEGDQPQAMATLHGLCDWVAHCLEHNDDDDTTTPKSKALHQIKTEDDLLTYHAIRAMATGIPREGHSVVGQGTYRDGEQGWDALAQEFIDLKLADEVELYKSRGATVVGIEHLADTKPAYLSSAGGAMVRLFFV